MNEITRAAKDTVILQVLRHIMAGMSKKDACALMNIDRTTFDRHVSENPIIIDEFIRVQQEIIRTEYAVIVTARQELIHKLANQVGDNLSLGEQLALENRLAQLQVNLEKQLGVSSLQQDNAEQYVKGLELHPAVTKITQTKTEVEFESLSPLPEIIDGEIIEEGSA